MTDSPTTLSELNGQPVVALSLPAGDRATVALHGAQALSWCTADGVEQLYLSPRARFDGASALRGGVPICFPQFNQRVIDGRALAKHGFARTLPWRLTARDTNEDLDSATFRIEEADLSDALRASWPMAFSAETQIRLTQNRLQVGFRLRNTGSTPWSFAIALHTYLRVDHIAQARLEGLHQTRYWDAVANALDERAVQVQTEPGLRFASETDRVYKRAPARLRLHEPGRTVSIEQSDSFTETVVWNPGAALCATLADLPADGYQHLLCVEAARIDTPPVLDSGASWSGWQRLTKV